jgi:hypothetical protein
MPADTLTIYHNPRKLGIAPAEPVRRNEPVFREKYDGKVMDDAQWIKVGTGPWDNFSGRLQGMDL